MKSRALSRQRRTDFIRLDTRRCDACWDCIEICTKRVFGKIDLPWHRHAIVRNAEACNGCRKCVRACGSMALADTCGSRLQAAGRVSDRLAADASLSAYNKHK